MNLLGRTMLRSMVAACGLLAFTLPFSGQSSGSAYGTRDPETCKVRTAPSRGAPTAAQAAQYVRCGWDSIGTNGEILLAENVRVEVGPGRRYEHIRDSFDGIDPRQLVYPIRGSFTAWSCDLVRTAAQVANGFPDNHGKNCSHYENTHAAGICYKTSFGEWFCNMGDPHADVVGGSTRNVAPPQ